MRKSVNVIVMFCGSVQPIYSDLRTDFMCKLQELLGGGYKCFESLNSFERASFVLGSELWEGEFSSMLDLVKGYIVDVWELRKAKLYGKISAFDSPSSLRFHLGNWGVLLGAVVSWGE